MIPFRQLAKLTFFIFTPIAFLNSCGQKSKQDIIIGNWKLTPAPIKQVDFEGSDSLQFEPPEQEPPPPQYIPERGASYTFLNDSIVDTRQEYYKIIWPPTGRRLYRFIGTTTNYKIIGDSLLIYNLTDSVWEKGRHITKLDKDTLVLTQGDGQKDIFLRYEYNLNEQPKFDQIALSSSGCFGSCPIINIIISSTGEVVFYGEMYVDKLGFYEGTISKELFSRIENKFRRANIENLKDTYSVNWTDDETITTTFCIQDKIFKSIDDYGRSGSDELVWAYPSLRYLFQDIQLARIDSTKIPPYLDLHFFKFEKRNEICQLAQSESFLLWNYLRKGKQVSNSFEGKFELSFARNYIWAPSYDELDDPYDRQRENRVTKAITDGRYFKFEINGQNSTTIDIGFNYLTTNKAILKFRQKKEYD